MLNAPDSRLLNGIGERALSAVLIGSGAAARRKRLDSPSVITYSGHAPHLPRPRLLKHQPRLKHAEVDDEHNLVFEFHVDRFVKVLGVERRSPQ
jgi:hypothetical protein